MTVFIPAPRNFSFLKYFPNQVSDDIFWYLVWELSVQNCKQVDFYENEEIGTICFVKVNRSLDSSGKSRYIVSVYVYYLATQIGRSGDQSKEISRNRNGNSVRIYKNWQTVEEN